jgi:hypothetical protein
MEVKISLNHFVAARNERLVSDIHHCQSLPFTKMRVNFAHAKDLPKHIFLNLYQNLIQLQVKVPSHSGGESINNFAQFGLARFARRARVCFNFLRTCTSSLHLSFSSPSHPLCHLHNSLHHGRDQDRQDNISGAPVALHYSMEERQTLRRRDLRWCFLYPRHDGQNRRGCAISEK